mgnify:CR=1 FL=1
MEKNKCIMVISYVMLCIAITSAGCGGNKDDAPKGVYHVSDEQKRSKTPQIRKTKWIPKKVWIMKSYGRLRET